jgi:S-formylglutathione hydrolase FrmB
MPWVTPAVRAPRVRQYKFASAAAKTEVSYHVYQPEAYDTDGDRRFPVLYWLHGSGGGGAGIAPLAARFDAAIRTGSMPPMLVVFPNGMPMGMWCDWKDGSVPMETVVIRELIPQVDSRFRTVAARQGRIIDGFSMGGYGAARLGFKHPDRFIAVSLMGAGPLQPDFTDAPRAGPKGRDKVFQQVFGGDKEYYRAVSPWRIAEQQAPSLRTGLAIRQVIGDRDETLRFNRDFHQRLEKLGIPHQYRELPGVKHDPLAVLDALGEANWEFYRAALERAGRSG